MGAHQSEISRFGNLLLPLAYDSDSSLFLLKGNRLGFAFQCTPLAGVDDKVSARINTLLNNDWPEDTLIQFVMFANPNISMPLNNMLSMRTHLNEDVQRERLLREATEARGNYLENGTVESVDKTSNLLVRDIQLVITVTMPIADWEPTEREIDLYKDKRMQFETALSGMGMYPRTLTAKRYVELLGSILNQGPGASWRDRLPIGADDDKPLCEQVLDYDKAVEASPEHLKIGDTYVKTLSVKRNTKSAYLGYAAYYLGDFFTGSQGIRDNCMITMTIHFPNPHSTKDALSTKRTWANNQAYGPLLKFVPALAAKKRGFDVLFKALDDGDAPVRYHLSCTVFAQSKERVVRAASEARSWWSVRQIQLLEDRYSLLPMFLNQLPFGAEASAMRETYRYKTAATRHVIPLLPIFSDWGGTGTPLMSFISRNGQLMMMDLFDSPTNYNCFIAAQSGSGKSFATNFLITSYLSTGALVWVIDVGRSYEKLARAYEGDFIEFTQEASICLNPFELIRQYEDEEDAIVGLVSAMAAPTQALSDLQTAGLRRHLSDVWSKKGQAMMVDDIERSLLEDPEPRVRDIGHQLFAFTSKGQYGKYFNGKNNVNFKNPFNVLELEELKGRKHLQQVVLLQLIYQIQQEMYLGDRDRRKIVIIDEAWSLLTEGDVAKFIEHGYRRFRKYGGAAITITQSVNDLYESPTGRAIAENSANVWLLGQKKDAINQIKTEQRLPLSDGGYELLKTVHTAAGRYSEIFFMCEGGYGVGRLIVDPFSQLLYSTKAEDVQAIKNYTSQGIPTGDAIRRLLRERNIHA